MTVQDYMIEKLDSTENQDRREWMTIGCDWAYFICKFLQARRQVEILPEEIIATKLYARSNEIERRALEMVCRDPNPLVRATPEGEQRLREADNWFDAYVDGKYLGHANWVAQLNAIPDQIAERQRFDSHHFKVVYPSPEIFQWIWKPRPEANS